MSTLILHSSQQHSKTRKGIEPRKTPSLPRKRMGGARTTVKRGRNHKQEIEMLVTKINATKLFAYLKTGAVIPAATLGNVRWYPISK